MFSAGKIACRVVTTTRSRLIVVIGDDEAAEVSMFIRVIVVLRIHVRDIFGDVVLNLFRLWLLTVSQLAKS